MGKGRECAMSYPTSEFNFQIVAAAASQGDLNQLYSEMSRAIERLLDVHFYSRENFVRRAIFHSCQISREPMSGEEWHQEAVRPLEVCSCRKKP